MKTDDGGPAFPGNRAWAGGGGMTLRDWFAGQALAGICADDASNDHCQEELALSAYSLADAMLKEKEKP